MNTSRTLYIQRCDCVFHRIVALPTISFGTMCSMEDDRVAIKIEDNNELQLVVVLALGIAEDDGKR